jgi:hypothetical protein
MATADGGTMNQNSTCGVQVPRTGECEMCRKELPDGCNTEFQGDPHCPLTHGVREPIPDRVYWAPLADNFYSAEGQGMGLEFYAKWKPRRAEFPQGEAFGFGKGSAHNPFKDAPRNAGVQGGPVGRPIAGVTPTRKVCASPCMEGMREPNGKWTGPCSCYPAAGVEAAPAPNPCKLTECQGKPRCKPCLVMDASYGVEVVRVETFSLSPPSSEETR